MKIPLLGKLWQKLLKLNMYICQYICYHYIYIYILNIHTYENSVQNYLCKRLLMAVLYIIQKVKTTKKALQQGTDLNNILGTSLVVWWIRIHLPVQGLRVQFCPGKVHVPQSNKARAPQLVEPAHSRATGHSYGARVLQLPKPACLEPVPHKGSHQ